MASEEEIRELIFSKDNFPRMLKKNEGVILKNNFKIDENFKNGLKEKTTIERRYIKYIDEYKFILLEEFLFKENETSLDLNKSIDTKYYLSKKIK